MPRAQSFGGRLEYSLVERLLRLNWLLVFLLAGVASIGVLMQFSVAGGDLDPWARRHIVRASVGFGIMIVVALIDLRWWRRAAWPIYAACLALLIVVEVSGEIGMGAQRWIDLGVLRLQPSELMKVGLVMALAAYYHWLPPENISRPLWLAPPILLAAAPAALVVVQPDLGTAVFLLATAAIVMFVAGVSWWWFASGGVAVGGAVWAVLASRGTSWQILKDYQYRRIETFLDPSQDPLGSGYHITQSTIAIGSGGFDGQGFMQGSQTHLRFLPEPETDFIFTSFAEEFGFRGGATLLGLFVLVVMILTLAASRMRAPFGRLVAVGVAAVFFLFFAINMAMVMGLTPVVGVPLPLVSYGGSSLLALLFGFGVAMSAQIHADDDLRG